VLAHTACLSLPLHGGRNRRTGAGISRPHYPPQRRAACPCYQERRGQSTARPSRCHGYPAVGLATPTARTAGRANHTVRGFFAGLKKRSIEVTVLERVRQVGPNEQGAKGSYSIYRVAEAG
jgi:hypothetical protein